MSCSSYGNFGDYMTDVYLELGAKFYPLPAVASSEMVAYPLDALEDEYTFASEDKAIKQYEEHKFVEEQRLEALEKERADLEEQANQTLKALPDDDTEMAEVVECSDDSGADIKSTTDAAPSSRSTDKGIVALTAGSLNGVLVPQQAPLKTSAPTSTDDQSATDCKPGARKLPKLSWDDFLSSAANDPFDALEIRTIDEKAALQQLLDQYHRQERTNDSSTTFSETATTSETQKSTDNDIPLSTSATSISGEERRKEVASSLVPNTVARYNGFVPSVADSDLKMKSTALQSRDLTATDIRNSDNAVLPPTIPVPLRPSSLRYGCDDSDPMDVFETPNGPNEKTPLKLSKSSPDLSLLTKMSGDINDQSREVSCAATVDDCFAPAVVGSKSQVDETETITSQLTASERRTVESVAAIGFSPELVVRCLRRLNTQDAAHLVSNLLVVQPLVQMGMPSDIVVEAVISAAMDEEKAKQFAKSAVQLRGLGFGDSAVFDALRTSGGSRDGALDILLPSSS